MKTTGSGDALAAEVRREVEITTADGHALAGHVYEPAPPVSVNGSRAGVLILPATATPQSYYTSFATYLAAAGIRVLTFDYRGMGASRRGALRGLDASMTGWARRDAVAAFDHLKAEHPDDRVVLVGHSFGGQSLGLAERLHAADAAILVGAQLGWFGHWPPASRLRLALTWHVAFPALCGAFGYMPGWAGMELDLPKGAALEWARWCIHPDYLMGHDPEARARFAAFGAPTMFWSFTDDDFAPEASTDALISALGGARLQHYRLAPEDLGVRRIGHFGFFRRGFEETLWRAARDFVSDVAGGRAPRRAAGFDAAWQRPALLRIEEAEILRDLRSAPAQRPGIAKNSEGLLR